MKPLRKNIRSYLMLAVVLCSTFINIFSSIQSVHAAPAPPAPTDPAALYIAPEAQADAVAAEYSISLALCLTGNNNGGDNLTSTDNSGLGTQISAQDAANGNWFQNDVYEVRPSILVWSGETDSNGLGCQDLLKNGAAQALGATDNIVLACAVGLTRTDGKDCLTDPQQSNFQETSASTDAGKIYQALAKLRQYSVTPPLVTHEMNDALLYVVVMQTLTQYCQATPVANVNGPLATPAVKAQYHNNQIAVVDGTGNTTSVYYKIPDGGKNNGLENFSDNFQYWVESCGNMVNDSVRFAPAYAAYVKAHPQTAGSASSGSNSNPPDETSCNIQGIGWIVCPVMRFMAQVTDYAYGVVSDMLTTPALDTSTSSPMYAAWSIIRNFSNVALVIVFLFIVYSQITGVGINNYGVKKMLPRLVMAAVLINVSYWICAIAIDISNILGSSLSGLLEGASNQLYVSGHGFTQSGAGGGWDTLTVGLITGVAVAAALYAGLSVLVPLLIAALISIITIVIILTARQAILTLLTALSPALFFAYALPIPGIQPLGKKGIQLYTALLLLFPDVALLFGGSKLASTVLMNNPNASFTLKVMAAGVTIVPLIITPMLLKASTSILGRIGGFVNNPNRGPFDRMRKGAAGYRQNRQEYRKLKALTGYRTLPGRGVLARRGAQREAVLNNRKAELNKANSAYVAGMALNNEGFRNRLSQGGGEGADQRALATAISVQAKLKADEVTAATAIIKSANLEGDIKGLQQLILGDKDGNHKVEYTDPTTGARRTLEAPPGSALQSAAIAAQFAIGDIPSTDAIVSASGSMGVDQRQAIAQGMQSLSKKVKYYGGSSGNAVAQGKVNSEADLNKLVADTVQGGKYGVNEAIEGDHDSLSRVATVVADPTSTTTKGTAIDDKQKDALRAVAKEIRENDTIKKPAARVMTQLDHIEKGEAGGP